jgi:hypothetical protein
MDGAAAVRGGSVPVVSVSAERAEGWEAMSAFSLFGGRFDRDAADCAWSERDEPEGPRCPYCGRVVDVMSDGRLVCPQCEVWWGDEDELEIEREAVDDEPPEVE